MALKKPKPPKWDKNYAETKRRCRPNMEDIREAKKLGMSPRGLIWNIPPPGPGWKAPVRDWIREFHERKFAKNASPSSRDAALRGPLTIVLFKRGAGTGEGA